MKRLAILSCFFVYASAFAQDVPKKVSPLKGWSIIAGEWTKEKNGARSPAAGEGHLEWQGSATSTIELQFYVTLVKLTEGIQGQHSLAISWDADDTGRRNVAFIGQRSIKVTIFPANGAAPAGTSSCSLPMKRRVPIRAKITKKGIQMAVGGQKIAVSIPSTSLTKLRLYVNGMDAVFTKIKIKSK